RGDETVLVCDGAQSNKPPEGMDTVFPIGDQQIKLTDEWVGADWGDNEDLMWDWYKEHGTEISREEAGRTPTPLHASGEEVHEEEGSPSSASSTGSRRV
ncbi:MAG: hypothetical protein ACXAEN_20440, partial [Candidatus Thorarchaeota archaeon]